MGANSTVSPQESKPSKKDRDSLKPTDDFPLYPHLGSGQWCKKIKGKARYFGVIDKPAEAFYRLKAEFPKLVEGKTIPPSDKPVEELEEDLPGRATLRVVCNEFLMFKEKLLKGGELSPRTFRDYYGTCKRLISHFGKHQVVKELESTGFFGFREKLSRKYGPVTLKNEINRVQIVMNFALAKKLIPEKPDYGYSFDKPSALQLRRAKNKAGVKLFEREEILKMLEAADVPMRAMILLGCNGGLGNTDVGNLPIAAVDLSEGWLNYPRIKTEVPRRIPLWPETIRALELAIACRPKPEKSDYGKLVFLTRHGRPFVRNQEKKKLNELEEKVGPEASVPIDSLAPEFRKFLDRLEILPGRSRRGFYCLRHCFETFGGEAKDQTAVDAIMGHCDATMSANYRHRISDERLKAVVNVVRDWLFGVSLSSGAAKKGGNEK